ncbi:MAG: ribose transport system ATP-binding protein [Microbacterium sp.]|nr:ribose transport system ATP-binding protein [Microbacterium sp.]
MTSGSALQARGIVKRYPGVVALDGVDLDVRYGEVHALVGENGAGKSTLVRILGGVHPPDAGTVELDGRPFRPETPQESLAAGIRVVHQELSTLPSLSVAENLFLDHLPRRAGFVNVRELHERARAALTRVGLDVAPTRRMETLSLAQAQLVEIARALATDARVVIFDEPTSTLTAPEKRHLLSLIAELREQGTAVIYISHHLDEIFDVCDRATVLRNGRTVATHTIDELTTDELVRLMVGRELVNEDVFPHDAEIGDEVLRVDGLRSRDGLVKDVSFEVRAGEIVGFAGLVGAGRTETARAVFGADRPAAGTVQVHGRPVRTTHPRRAVEAGISFATEDRKSQGLLLTMGVDANVTLASIDRIRRAGFLRRRLERSLTADMIKRLVIKVRSGATAVGTLSGGNQQKVVLARWILRDSDVLIVDEPTRGIDVGARHEIYRDLAALARAGKAIVVVSSDLNELFALSHRILVFSRGRIVAEVPRAEFDQERILTHAYSGYRTAVAS